jgi:hypothetical protein
MRYPPPITISLQSSRVYTVFAVLVAITLLAIWAVFIWSGAQFGISELAWALGVAAVSLALWRDAIRQPVGQLQYAQGPSLWHTAGRQSAGTLRVFLDLQGSLLVSLAAHRGVLSISNTTMQWFHLEAKQIEKAAGSEAWVALRRAVYGARTPHETVVA